MRSVVMIEVLRSLMPERLNEFRYLQMTQGQSEETQAPQTEELWGERSAGERVALERELLRGDESSVELFFGSSNRRLVRDS
jgi:hypothetical protein